MFREGFAYIQCPNCKKKFQALTEIAIEELDGTITTMDTDHEELSRITDEHWHRCTVESPWPEDPNAKE